MKNKITHFDWRTELKEYKIVDSIGDDLILTDKLILPSTFQYPFKVDMVNTLICLKGTIKGKINMKPYTTKASEMMILLADQILELECISDDFEGLVIVMSKRFLEGFELDDSFSIFTSVYNNPCIPLSTSDLEAMKMYYNLTLNAIRVKDNPHRLEIVRLLTKAFFYGAGYYFHKMDDNVEISRNKALFDNFMKLVQKHFKEQRNLDFYASKLCLTPKYMSSVIKEAGGKSAGEWIDERVILEVKALLKSTNMTIQQISDELNFPTQSSFGKYFKRLTGISPKEYRNN